MSGIACTHVEIGWIGGVLYSRVAWTHFCFRGPEGRLVYVGQGPAYVVVTPQVFGFHICIAFHEHEHHGSIREPISHET